MNQVKTLGLLAIAAAALMAFAGSASATTLTSPTNTVYENDKQIKAVAEKPHTKLDGTIVVTCEESIVEGRITEMHTVKGTIMNLTFKKCGNNTVTVIPQGPENDFGYITINNAHEVFSTGTEVTVLTHNILGTVHCIYLTNNTRIGTLTDSHERSESTATLDIGSAGIPQKVTDGACKNDAVWTGNYEVTVPDKLYVDTD